MTTTETSPSLIFDDARRMHEAALARMAADDIRDAAEKAWCATLRATEALILTRTGKLPPRSPDVSRRLINISDADPAVYALRLSYFNRQESLHGQCFYHEYCPVPGTHPLIHETADFIRDAESLAEK